MKPHELLEHLAATLDDRRLSRSERRALHATLREAPLTARERGVVEAGVVDAAAEAMHDPRDRQVLRWLADVLGALRADSEQGQERRASRAWFGPDDPLADLLVSLLASARQSIDAAVFTITDDRIHDALVDAHRRGVLVRILSDDDKASDPGSDIWRLGRAGVEVRTDHSPSWMHHKFAVLDQATLLNGSYNWTRAGANENRENFLLTADPLLVRSYRRKFDQLWREFG